MWLTLGVMAWIVGATILFGCGAILASFLDRHGVWPHRVARAWARSILFASRIRVQIKGEKRLDHDGAYIYMANHQSNFDIPVLLGHLKVQFRWLAKIELFRIPLFGLAMRRVGYISIDRSNRQRAIQSLKQAARIIRGGVSVMIFPEGTRSLEFHMKDFKKGGFILAIESGVPIVPVVIHGTFAIMPKTRFRMEPGPVCMEILAPIETSAYTVDQKDELMAEVHAVMEAAFESGKHRGLAC